MVATKETISTQCTECGQGWAKRRRYFVRLVSSPDDRSEDRVLCKECLKNEEVKLSTWAGVDPEGTPYPVFLCKCGVAQRGGVTFRGLEDGKSQALCNRCAEKYALNLLFHPGKPRPVASRFHAESLT